MLIEFMINCSTERREFLFNSEKKRFVLYGIVTASGAGKESDPLSIYDVTFYFTNV